MTDWYLIFCKSNQEHITQQNLLRQGFDVYLPQVTKKQVLKEQVVIKAKAMFPRYLFVKARDEQVSLAAIRSTIGAIGLVRFGIEPAVVNPSLIEHLKGKRSAPPTGEEKYSKKPWTKVRCCEKVAITATQQFSQACT